MSHCDDSPHNSIYGCRTKSYSGIHTNHHSGLQPIETIWALEKGRVGMAYTSSTTFKQVRERLVDAIDALLPSTIKKCINKSEMQLQAICKTIEDTDDRSGDEEDEESNSESDDDTSTINDEIVSEDLNNRE
ncbi:hypothetical protein THRCLA_21478 [Thraustotheca clavata]|uniref:Uncharacterized protein n=1 Tax=Thraustotheca clavata TaxID=74557 RepID=A0A1V9ZW18_9STRA|nr:hypothetical protein THRCLA_21478 [Thraustotheca clavata]